VLVKTKPKRSLTSTAPTSTHGLKQQTFEPEDFQRLSERLEDQLTEKHHKRTRSGSMAAVLGYEFAKPSPSKVLDQPLITQIKASFLEFKRRHQTLKCFSPKQQMNGTERLLLRMMFKGWLLAVNRRGH
jgi:hypothetical protein